MVKHQPSSVQKFLDSIHRLAGKNTGYNDERAGVLLELYKYVFPKFRLKLQD